MATVVGDQLAKAMNISTRRVQQLTAEGMPKAKRGRYDLVPCLEWYVRFLQNAVEHRQTLTGRAANDAVKRERAHLLHAQVQKAERQNLIASGEVVPLDVMRSRLSTVILQARQNLLQLPTRIAPQLEGEPRLLIKEKLRAEIYAALAALAVNGNGNGSHPEPMDSDAPRPSLLEH
jgi:phage terminase Nu1 subunit (DNA packaging protein)